MGKNGALFEVVDTLIEVNALKQLVEPVKKPKGALQVISRVRDPDTNYASSLEHVLERSNRTSSTGWVPKYNLVYIDELLSEGLDLEELTLT